MEPSNTVVLAPQSTPQQVYIALGDGLLVPVTVAPSQLQQSVSLTNRPTNNAQYPSTSGLGIKHKSDDNHDLKNQKKLKTCDNTDHEYYLQNENNGAKPANSKPQQTPVKKHGLGGSVVGDVDKKSTLGAAGKVDLQSSDIENEDMPSEDPNNILLKKNYKNTTISSDDLYEMLNSSMMNNSKRVQLPGVAYRPARLLADTNRSKQKRIPHSIPIPKDIDEFGECLNTRIGKYHYGLTDSDPPCQFFRGVLKGPTGKTTAVLFGDTDLINKISKLPLSEVGHFVIDNSFAIAQKTTVGVNRVMTINLLYHDQVIPLWYAITSCSSKELYKRIIIEFYQYVLDWQFVSVLLNDDPDLCKAVLAVFPDVEIYGSWYHYCCSVWNELRRNNLHEECNSNPKLLLAVKMLFVVPYLPPPESFDPPTPNMVDGLQMVKKIAQDNNLPAGFLNVLDFVETFWFNTVECKNCSVFGVQTRLINHVEITQLSLLSFMQPKGNVWTLTRAFQKFAKATNIEVTKLLEGKPYFPKRKRCGMQFVKQIRFNAKKLLLGTCDLKSFLETSAVYCEEVLDVFLHPLYLSMALENSSHFHVNKWKIKINTNDPMSEVDESL